MLSRRRFLAAAALASLPVPGWAAAGSPALLAAAREASGAFALYGLTASGAVAFRIPLPDRGHAAAAHPDRAEAVAFARRPGTFALVIDCAAGRMAHRLDAPAGRHFYGHGAFLDGGRVLATTENEIDTGTGILGLWDAAAGYARIGEVETGGIGPHEVVRLPGTEVLAVANGGIRTHPDHGREKLNIATMRPSLAYVEDGRLVEQVALPERLHRASIRHLAVRADGMVAVALQWQGSADPTVPLLATHRRGAALLPRLAGAADQALMEGYAGSAAFSGDGTEIAITGPRGSVAHVYTAEGDGPPRLVHRPDICGVAPLGAGLAFTDGTGGLIGPDLGVKLPLAWDNHLVPAPA